MNKHFLIALCVFILAGCSKSGTGGYDTSQSGASNSLEPRTAGTRYGQPLSGTNTVNKASSTLGASENLASNAPIPSGSVTSGNLGTAGSVGTESGRTTSDSNTRITGGQSSLDITTPNPTYQAGPLDKALSEKVKTSLHVTDSTGKPLDLSHIRVSAAKGVVTLQGTVRSETERQAIANEVQRMNGVVVVKNELHVSPEATAQGSANNNPEQTGTSSSKKD